MDRKDGEERVRERERERERVKEGERGWSWRGNHDDASGGCCCLSGICRAPATRACPPGPGS